MVHEVTEEMIVKVARKMCVRSGLNPDEQINGINMLNPIIGKNWRLFAAPARDTLLALEALYEVLSEEKNGQ